MIAILPLFELLSEGRAEVVVKALLFTKSNIVEWYRKSLETASSADYDAIESEVKEQFEEIDSLVCHLREKVTRLKTVEARADDKINSVIRSACDIYLEDVKETKAEIGKETVDSLIERINDVLQLEDVKRAKGGLFDKYCYFRKHAPTSSQGKKPNVEKGLWSFA